MKKKQLLLLSIIGFLVIITALINLQGTTAVIQKVVINEVCSLNGNIIEMV